MDNAVGVLLVIAILLAIGIWIYLKRKIYVESQTKYKESLAKHDEKMAELMTSYKKALLGTDKEDAIKAGCLYYQELRHGSVTGKDEIMILNDVSTMNLNKGEI